MRACPGVLGFNEPVALDGFEGWAYSDAVDVSADGKIVVGHFKPVPDTTVYTAFRWAEGEDTQSLDRWLAGSGITGSDRV